MSEPTLYRKVDPEQPTPWWLVPVEPDIDQMTGYLSTVDFTPSQNHPDAMRPIVVEMLRIAGIGGDDAG